MLKVFLISFLLLLAAIVFMAVRIIVKKDGNFSSQHIGENQLMRKEGITCATSQDRKAQHSKKLNVKEL